MVGISQREKTALEELMEAKEKGYLYEDDLNKAGEKYENAFKQLRNQVIDILNWPDTIYCR